MPLRLLAGDLDRLGFEHVARGRELSPVVVKHRLVSRDIDQKVRDLTLEQTGGETYTAYLRPHVCYDQGV